MTAPRLEDHTRFDEIEEAFHAALEQSLDPRGPESLFHVVDDLGLPAGAAVVDVGCGRGEHSLELARRYGFEVLGIDPAPRHHAVERRARQLPLEGGSLRFTEAAAEAIPVPDGSQDLIFCRESLAFTDLDAAVSEFERVLRPGGRGLVYLVLPGPLMREDEAVELGRLLGGTHLSPAVIEQALVAAGLRVDDRVDFAGEWAERAQERDGTPGRRLLYAARLLRDRDRYVAEFGQTSYDIMLGDCLWHVYRLLGKLAGYACAFTKPTA